MNKKTTDAAVPSTQMKIFIHRNGETYGPYDRKMVEGFVQEKRASLRDWVSVEWREQRVRLENVLQSGKVVAAEEDSMDAAAVAATVEKIENLVKNDRAEHALDLVKGLNEPKLYAELLEDCWIDPNGNLHLSSFYYGNRFTFFLRLVAHCPEEAGVTRSLRSENLTTLKLEDYYSLEDLDFLSELTSLKALKVKGCRQLKNIDGLSGLANLEDLELKECSKLTDLAALAQLTNLQDLNLTDCSSLSDLKALAKLPDLQRLNLRGCGSLKDPQAIEALGVQRAHLPEHMMAKLTLTEVHEVIVTKYFYLSDEFIEDSPFDSVEELQEAIEEGSEDWEEFSCDVQSEYDDEEEFWRSDSKGMTYREWNLEPL